MRASLSRKVGNDRLMSTTAIEKVEVCTRHLMYATVRHTSGNRHMLRSLPEGAGHACFGQCANKLLHWQDAAPGLNHDPRDLITMLRIHGNNAAI
jgi:hypothetical protein